LSPPVLAAVHPECERAAVETARLLEEFGHAVDEVILPTLLGETRRASDEVWAVLAGEGVAAGEGLLGRPVTADDVEPLTWALYEKARALDALSYRRAHAEIQRAARRMVLAGSACDVLVTPTLARPPVPTGTITGGAVTGPRWRRSPAATGSVRTPQYGT
jgi:amidase